ncbi:hypothetical protein JCM9279_002369 [Rhodotorula babjevae]
MPDFVIEIPPRRRRRVRHSRLSAALLRLPVEIMDEIATYLEDIKDDRERIVLGGRLALVSKELIPFGRRVTWSRTNILCSERNLVFATELAARPDLLANVRSLTFEQPDGQSASSDWVGHMIWIVQGCTSALELLDCATGFCFYSGDDQSLALRSHHELLVLAGLPVAATLKTLRLRVVFGPENYAIDIRDLVGALDQFIELKALFIRSTWTAPIPAHAPGGTIRARLDEIFIDDRGLSGQPSLFQLLSPCLDASQIKYLRVYIGRSSFGGPEQLGRFVNLVHAHLDAFRGMSFANALPQWVAGLSHLGRVRHVSLGPTWLTASANLLGPSTVPLDVLLASLPPSVETYKVERIYFVNNLGLDFFSHREHVLGDRHRFKKTTMVHVRLDDPDLGRRRLKLCRLNKPDGTQPWGIFCLVKKA